MSHILTFFERAEIHELLSLKISSLTQSKLFLRTVEGDHYCGSLEADIKLSSQEIMDLEDLLLYSAI